MNNYLNKISGFYIVRRNYLSGPFTSVGSYDPRREKTCLRGFANNTGADQHAQLHSLIRAFVICFLENTIFNLAASKISIF